MYADEIWMMNLIIYHSLWIDMNMTGGFGYGNTWKKY